MIVKPNMGLVVWTSINDYFSHVQLAANFEALDAHNHTSGKGAKIGAGGIAEQAVEYNNLASGVIEALTTNVKSGLALPVNKTIWQEAAVTRANTTYGSFSTPLKTELGKIKANQLIEIRTFGVIKDTVESASGTGGAINLVISSSTHTYEMPFTLYTLNASVALAANTALSFTSTTGLVASALAKATESQIVRGVALPSGLTSINYIWPFTEEIVNVELQGKSVSGTISAEKFFMNVRAY